MKGIKQKKNGESENKKSENAGKIKNFKIKTKAREKWTNQRRNRSGGGQSVAAPCFR